MNERLCFDYKTPIGAQNDYRTSTYRGHLKLPEHVSEPKNRDFSLDQKQYLESIVDEERCLTENQEKFSLKILQPSIAQKADVKGINFMKSFDETHFRNYPKLTKPMNSVSQRDYKWKSKNFEEHPPIIHLATSIEANKDVLVHIDRCKSGFGKLLHPSATTNNLAYRAYSTEELGSTSRNIITFWNWKNTFENKHTFWNVANKCFKPRRQYQSFVKHVPNSGLTTETKSKYIQHLNLTDCSSSNINNQFINYFEVPNETKSENTIYGSGVRIQKYLA